MKRHGSLGLWRRAMALSMAMLALLPIEHPFGLDKRSLGHKHLAITHKS